jgi:hypothetical protein
LTSASRTPAPHLQCATSYGCDHCDVQLDGQGTANRSLNIGRGYVDMCSLTYGGGSCSDDFNCVNGLCINGKCKCNAGTCSRPWASCPMDSFVIVAS